MPVFQVRIQLFIFMPQTYCKRIIIVVYYRYNRNTLPNRRYRMMTQTDIQTITNRLKLQSGYSINYKCNTSVTGLVTHCWHAIDSGLMSPILFVSYGSHSGTLPRVSGYRHMLPNNRPAINILDVLDGINLQVGYSAINW